MKHILVLAIFLFSLGHLSAQKSPAPAKTQWTLEDCIHYATDKNIAVLQAELSKKISENTLLQSKLNLLPTISANASYGFSFGNSIDPTTYSYVKQNSQTFSPYLQSNLNLFTGLQQINTIHKDKFDALAYTQDFSAAVNNTALNVTNLFLQLVVNKELIKAAQKQVDISQSQLDLQKGRIRAGTMAEASIYDFDAQLSRDQAALISQQNAEFISLLTLKIALQLPDDQPFDIIIPDVTVGSVMTFTDLDPHQVYEYALTRQPSVQAAQARATSARYAIRIAKGSLSPTLSVSTYTRDNYFDKATTFTFPPKPVSLETQFKNNFANGVTFNASIPIFTGWQKMTNVANSKLQYKLQLLNVENSRNSLMHDIYQAYANAKGNAQSYSANLSALQSQQKAYETTTKKYNAGLATNFDMELSKSNLARSESNTIQAKYNYIFSVKILDFYQGKPITLN